MSIRAVFFDKDGTLVEDIPFNVDLEQIRLASGAPGALRKLADLGFKLFIISNQPGAALGKMTMHDIRRTMQRVETLLDFEGIDICQSYWCSHGPDAGCGCRKPASGLLLRAARDHDIDLSRSWMVGDILDDIEAGKRTGCRTILLNNGNETDWDLSVPVRQPDFLSGSLSEAASLIENTHVPPRNVCCYDSHFAQWQEAKNLLCVRLDAMGDVLMTSPAFRALKVSRTGRTITVLTSSSGAEAVRLDPYVDNVLVYEAPWMKHPGMDVFNNEADFEMLNLLRARQFDAAVIFTVYSQSALPAALFCHLAGIPLRLAYARENPYFLLTDWRRECEPEKFVRHEVRRQLDLVASVGASTGNMRLQCRIPSASGIIDDTFESLPKGLRVVVIHAGASAPSRRYSEGKYGAVLRALVEQQQCAVLLTGSPEERILTERVNSLGGNLAHNLAGLLSMADLVYAVSRADLLIANNTGPVHIAAAVGTPVVDVYALTNPQHTPWLIPNRVLFHDVPCRYCYKSICPEGHHNCLELVPPEQVVRAADELLARARACL